MRAALAAGVVLFLLVFAAGFVLGTLREVVLRPYVEPRLVMIAEVPVMIAITGFAAAFVVRSWNLVAMPSRLAAGLLAFVLLQLGEIAVGVIGFRRPLADVLSGYATGAGLFVLAVQSIVVWFPLLVRPQRGSA